MLTEIHLENFVLFDKAALPFGPGLNVISGETGAGKSLLAAALGQALGRRARTDAVRAEEPEAVVTVAFHLPLDRAARLLADTDVAPDDEGNLVFTRKIRRQGSSRLSINGRPVSAQTGRLLGGRLVDIAAQDEHSRLLEPSYQRDLLDAYGGLADAVERFGALFREASSLERRLAASESERARARERLEQIRGHLDRLQEVEPDPGRDATLEDRIRVLSHAEAIQALTDKALALLYDDEGAVQDAVAGLLKEAETFSRDSTELERACTGLRDILALLEESVRAFRDVRDTLDVGPEELEVAIERSEALKRLARRLDCTIEELPDVEARLRQEEADLSGWDGRTDSVTEKLAGLRQRMAETGAALGAERAATGDRLAGAVDCELAALGMDHASFRVSIVPRWQAGDSPDALVPHASSTGLDDVHFLLSPNPGEPEAPLADAASGGETSRAMLALKAALAAAHAPPVLFFDEVDAGVGGRLGEVVGRKLEALSRDHQVIVITHLAQVAARADRHLKVTKTVRGGRTLAGVETLDGAPRVEELAQMIHGKASTATTRKQAREMLRQRPSDS